MRRKLFQFALTCSYLLFAAMVVIYPRSHHADDVVFVESSRTGNLMPAPAAANARANEAMVARFQGEFAHSDFDRYWSNMRYEIHVTRGSVAFATVSDYGLPRPPLDKRPASLGRAAFSIGHSKLAPVDIASGLAELAAYQGSVDRAVTRVYTRRFPLTWFMLAAAILPVWHVVKRFRRPSVGRCAVCRYDLTGNVSGVCPECGNAVT